MMPHHDPFIIKESGGDIIDRDLKGWSNRAFEGTSIGETEVGSLKRVIGQRAVLLVLAVFLVLISLLVMRVIWLQGVEGKYWRSVAEGNRIKLEVINPSRGLIVDEVGKILAYNVASFRLVAVPAELPRDDIERQELLSLVLAKVPTPLLLQENITQLDKPAWLPLVIASPLPHDLALQLMTLTSQIKGFRVEPVAERFYNGGEALAHILGYVGPVSAEEYRAAAGAYQLTDLKGKVGLEAVYEYILRGRAGAKQVEVDANGWERKVFAIKPPLAGAKLHLTINSELQQLAYQSLVKAVKAHNGRGGSVVVLRPQDGAIKALVSYPSFDPNVFTSSRNSETIASLLADEEYPLLNRAIAGEYPPGSTIKPLVAAAALEEGVITPQTTFVSTGGIYVGNQFFADWKAGGHGLTNVYKAIAESVNTFFYLVAGGSAERVGLGITKLSDYFLRFGLGQVTGLDLTGERSGFVPTPLWKQEVRHDRWYRGDTYNVAIGQGNLLVTPLQLAAAYAALLNGGRLIQPYLVSEIVYPSGEQSITQPVGRGQIKLSRETTSVLQQAMRQTVLSGSARALSDLPLAVAGKTGTAQTGTQTNTHAWFVGYAPASSPEIVVAVMIEFGGEGSSAAVPVARDIFNWYAQISKGD